MPEVVKITDFTIEQKEFAERVLKERLKDELTIYNDAEKKTLPKHHGNQISFRCFKKLTPNTTPLTEGVTPDANSLNVTEYAFSVKQYGDFIPLTDRMENESFDQILAEGSELLGEEAAEVFNTVMMNKLTKGTNVFYANGKTKATIGASDVITINDLHKMKAIFQRNNVKPFANGKYVFRISPDVEYDFKAATATNASWVDIMKYDKSEAIIKGEIGSIAGFKIVVDNTIPTAADRGSGSQKVHLCLAYGKKAFAVTELAGENVNNISIIHKGLGSAGTNDPLNQNQTLGWKHDGFGVGILYDEALIRYEVAASFDTTGYAVEDTNRDGYRATNPTD